MFIVAPVTGPLERGFGSLTSAVSGEPAADPVPDGTFESTIDGAREAVGAGMPRPDTRPDPRAPEPYDHRPAPGREALSQVRRTGRTWGARLEDDAAAAGAAIAADGRAFAAPPPTAVAATSAPLEAAVPEDGSASSGGAMAPGGRSGTGIPAVVSAAAPVPPIAAVPASPATPGERVTSAVPATPATPAVRAHPAATPAIPASPATPGAGAVATIPAEPAGEAGRADEVRAVALPPSTASAPQRAAHTLGGHDREAFAHGARQANSAAASSDQGRAGEGVPALEAQGAHAAVPAERAVPAAPANPAERAVPAARGDGTAVAPPKQVIRALGAAPATGAAAPPADHRRRTHSTGAPGAVDAPASSATPPQAADAAVGAAAVTLNSPEPYAARTGGTAAPDRAAGEAAAERLLDLVIDRARVTLGENGASLVTELEDPALGSMRLSVAEGTGGLLLAVLTVSDPRAIGPLRLAAERHRAAGELGSLDLRIRPDIDVRGRDGGSRDFPAGWAPDHGGSRDHRRADTGSAGQRSDTLAPVQRPRAAAPRTLGRAPMATRLGRSIDRTA